MTTLLLLLVAAALVGLAVEIMVRLDRASRLAAPGGAVPRRHGRHAHVERVELPQNLALFILSAVLVLLVVATLV